ncbi:nucleoside triphosphate pyrophosphohydrolase family protein [Teredinibacter purpureus]|uniref:hypothetical protein n=1 Tax=Teredinibacter purpureus TaxID=2731756 RepID=UPI0005F7F6E5|nr:hypothetical protein [Teredinibacter purpureus]
MNKDIILNEFGRVAEATGRDFHNSPKHLATTITIESAKLLEHFQWMSELDSELIDDPTVLKAIASDMADLFIYATVLSHKLDMDPWAIVKDKLLINREQYIRGNVDESPEPQTSSAQDDEESTSQHSDWTSVVQRIASSREQLRDSSVRVKKKTGSK